MDYFPPPDHKPNFQEVIELRLQELPLINRAAYDHLVLSCYEQFIVAYNRRCDICETANFLEGNGWLRNEKADQVRKEVRQYHRNQQKQLLQLLNTLKEQKNDTAY